MISDGLTCVVIAMFWTVVLLFCAGCASPAVLVSPLNSGAGGALSVVGRLAVSEDLPSVSLDIKSETLTVGELCSGLSSSLGIPVVVVSEEVNGTVMGGEWSSAIAFGRELAARHDLVCRFRDGCYVFVLASDELEWLVWPSGLTQPEATGLVSSLGLAEKSSVTDGGVVVLGVRGGRLPELRQVLQSLDGSGQWLVQVTIVDCSSRSLVNAAFDPDRLMATDAGWKVTGGKVVDSFLVPVREGAERVQTFGQRIPYSTSHVTDFGTIVAGDIGYQEIRNEVGVTISTTTAGPSARVRIVSSKPEQQIGEQGLMAVSYEEIDSVVRVGDSPVLVGKMSRWRESSDWSVGRIFRLAMGGEWRRYEVWVHCVRVDDKKNQAAAIAPAIAAAVRADK